MKKIFAILALAITSTAFAGDYFSVDVDHVDGRKGASDSVAQYIRAGKSFGDYQLGIQGRTAKFTDNSVASSVEVYGSKNSINVAGITPFIGVGHDNGSATKDTYNYGLVGATYGRQVGPGFALLGVKTRVGTTENVGRTKQTLAFATYSIPVAKNVALNLNASRSNQDIKENALGLGLGFSF
jgi:hypothetical protein